MRFYILVLVCLCLFAVLFGVALVRAKIDEQRTSTVVVWPEELHAGEWWVPFAVHGQHGVARCGTVEEARMLYAVLARAMTNSSGGKNAE